MSARARISSGTGTYEVRRAIRADVPAIVDLIAADQIGAARERGGPSRTACMGGSASSRPTRASSCG